MMEGYCIKVAAYLLIALIYHSDQETVAPINRFSLKAVSVSAHECFWHFHFSKLAVLFLILNLLMRESYPPFINSCFDYLLKTNSATLLPPLQWNHVQL